MGQVTTLQVVLASFLTAALLFAVPAGAAPSPAPEPVLKGIDIFGSKQVSLEDVKARFGPQFEQLARCIVAQDMEHYASLLDGVVKGLKSMGAFSHAQPSIITYFPPKAGVYLTVDLVDESDRARRMPFSLPPTKEHADPDGLLAAWDAYQAKGFDLLRAGTLVQGDAGKAFHTIFGFDDPALAGYRGIFDAGVPPRKRELVDILRCDRSPTHRATAAFLLAHLADGNEVVRLLLPSLRDPSAEVRNNALRVLGYIALRHGEIDVPVAPVAAALHYPSTLDRNKASFVLLGLAERPACRAAILREGAVLLKMLALQQPNNHDPAWQILCKISGRAYGERDYAAWEKWLSDQGVDTRAMP